MTNSYSRIYCLTSSPTYGQKENNMSRPSSVKPMPTTITPPSVVVPETPATPSQPLDVQVVERLEDADKTVLDLAKAKRELAIANAKLAVSQGETADATYSNLVLRLALKYRLSDGDILAEDGTITRKS